MSSLGRLPLHLPLPHRLGGHRGLGCTVLLALLLLAPAAHAAAPAPEPEVRVAPQVTAGDHVVVSHVALPSGGFVIVYGDRDGEPRGLLGASRLLGPGVHGGVQVELAKPLPGNVTRLHAVLHEDDGDGAWEGSGWDEPLRRGDGYVSTLFPVEHGSGAALAARDHATLGDRVVLPLVRVPRDAQVTVHRDANGGPGEQVGQRGTLAPGTYRDLHVDLPGNPLPRDTRVPLWAVLRSAEGEPLTAAGEPIRASLTLSTYHPRLQAALGRGTGTTVPLVSVVSDGPAWVAVHPEGPDGFPDVNRTLGQVQLGAGVHEDVRVPLDEPLPPATRVYAVLHHDDPADGNLTYPRGDAAMVRGGMVLVEAYVVPDPPRREVPPTGVAALLLALGGAALARRQLRGVA